MTECNAHLFIGDDYGDNHSTIRCQLQAGHEGLHQEKFNRAGNEVIITWPHDERLNCEKHGLQSDSYCESCYDEEMALCTCIKDISTCAVHSYEG